MKVLDLQISSALVDIRVQGECGLCMVFCKGARVLLLNINENYHRGRTDVCKLCNLLISKREYKLIYRQDMKANRGDQGSDQIGYEQTPAPGGGSIIEAKIFSPLSDATKSVELEASITTKIMLLRSTGSLILLDTRPLVTTDLLRYVDGFWYNPVDCTLFDMMEYLPVWWAYGDEGLHLWSQISVTRQVKVEDES